MGLGVIPSKTADLSRLLDRFVDRLEELKGLRTFDRVGRTVAYPCEVSRETALKYPPCPAMPPATPIRSPAQASERRHRRGDRRRLPPKPSQKETLIISKTMRSSGGRPLESPSPMELRRGFFLKPIGGDRTSPLRILSEKPGSRLKNIMRTGRKANPSEQRLRARMIKPGTQPPWNCREESFVLSLLD